MCSKTTLAVGNALQLQPSGDGAVPKTPEIINSLMAITDPLEEYGKQRLFRPNLVELGAADSSGSATDSPTSPKSIQNMHSRLIKESLKLTLQKKRKILPIEEVHSPGHATKMVRQFDESSLDIDTEDDSSVGTIGDCGLTQEDEERRKRRRERNKIAATKCRLKKREKTVHLVQESEVLEGQNQDMKNQIQELEKERKRLQQVLSVHRPNCRKRKTPPAATNVISNSSISTNSTLYDLDDYVLTADSHQQHLSFDLQDSSQKFLQIYCDSADEFLAAKFYKGENNDDNAKNGEEAESAFSFLQDEHFGGIFTGDLSSGCAV